MKKAVAGVVVGILLTLSGQGQVIDVPSVGVRLACVEAYGPKVARFHVHTIKPPAGVTQQVFVEVRRKGGYQFTVLLGTSGGLGGAPVAQDYFSHRYVLDGVGGLVTEMESFRIILKDSAGATYVDDNGGLLYHPGNPASAWVNDWGAVGGGVALLEAERYYTHEAATGKWWLGFRGVVAAEGIGVPKNVGALAFVAGAWRWIPATYQLSSTASGKEKVQRWTFDEPKLTDAWWETLGFIPYHHSLAGSQPLYLDANFGQAYVMPLALILPHVIR
ncbi:MAG: hypothetical protein KA248_06195 [Kiritimatiellae bacterium]|nr:hypothetical protein [Kiritimatiellia bacterium]